MVEDSASTLQMTKSPIEGESGTQRAVQPVLQFDLMSRSLLSSISVTTGRGLTVALAAAGYLLDHASLQTTQVTYVGVGTYVPRLGQLQIVLTCLLCCPRNN